MKQLEGIVRQEQKVLTAAALDTGANCTHSLEVEIESWTSASILQFQTQGIVPHRVGRLSHFNAPELTNPLAMQACSSPR